MLLHFATSLKSIGQFGYNSRIRKEVLVLCGFSASPTLHLKSLAALLHNSGYKVFNWIMADII
jgi:hypothetical protein